MEAEDETMERWIKEKVNLRIPVETNGSRLTGGLGKKRNTIT